MKLYSLFIFTCLLVCCTRQPETNRNIQNSKATHETLKDRLVVCGDFDGDKKTDTLKESFYSESELKEVSKQVDSDYDRSLSIATTKKVVSQLTAKNLAPLTLDRYHSFGLLWLKNEGDLNNDGKDEIGLVIDWMDWSAVNTYRIYTYRNHKWRLIYSFEIREFDLLKPKPDELILKKSNGNYTVHTYAMGESVERKITIKDFR